MAPPAGGVPRATLHPVASYIRKDEEAPALPLTWAERWQEWGQICVEGLMCREEQIYKVGRMRRGCSNPPSTYCVRLVVSPQSTQPHSTPPPKGRAHDP